MHREAVHLRMFSIFCLKFLCNLLVTLKTMQNYNLVANSYKLVKAGLDLLSSL